MVLGIREEEIKEKLLSFSSFLSPNLNVPYKKVKISLRNKSIIYCQVLACCDSQVRLSLTAHSDFSSSIPFCQEAPSSSSGTHTGSVPRLCPGTSSTFRLQQTQPGRSVISSVQSVWVGLLQCWSLKKPKTPLPRIRLRSQEFTSCSSRFLMFLIQNPSQKGENLTSLLKKEGGHCFGRELSNSSSTWRKKF